MTGDAIEASGREIADQLGVSLVPVREAVRRLEVQGLALTQHLVHTETTVLTTIEGLPRGAGEAMPPADEA